MFWESFIIWSKELIINFSYFAIFLVSLVGTSTILIPFPIYLIIFFTVGLGLNPIIAGIVAGAGSATGELTGYLMGMGGRYVIKEKKFSKFVSFFTNLFKNYGFAVIAVTSFLPFPFDIIGIMSGMSNYDIKKFFVATFIGKTVRFIAIAYAGYFAIPYLIGWM